MPALVYLITTVVTLLILFVLIKAAVRSALEDHYKTVRWYEATGEWAGRRAPRAFSDVPAEAKN